MTTEINNYTFTVRDSALPSVKFQATTENAQQILDALAAYCHGDEGYVDIGGSKRWAGRFEIGNTKFSAFISGLKDAGFVNSYPRENER